MACMNICPQGAIIPREDSCGFIYPKVVQEKCIECGLCIEVCDFKKEKTYDSTIKKTYGLQHKDKEVLRKSTSGGAFTAISDWILQKNGAVIGAVMKEDFSVCHEIAYTAVERDNMRGSKYVQSATNMIYRDIKTLLKQGQYVLFVGTPCQCAGLSSYIGSSYEKLYIVDFLCHGVPSNTFFKEHISYLEGLEEKNATDYIFRNKYFGWYSQGIEGIAFEGDSFAYAYLTQAYWNFFINNVSLRPSCLNCKYRSYHRYSDITIADFWGVEKITRKRPRSGMSLVFVNSDKGLGLINQLDSVAFFEVPFEQVRYRVSLRPPVSKYDTDEFWKLYREKGYAALVERYIDNSLKARFRFTLKKLKRRIL